MTFRKYLFIFIILLCGNFSALAQVNSELTYNLEFLKAVSTDKDKNSVNAIFKITPKLLIDFPPVIGGKYTIDINNENAPEIIILSKQDERKLNIQLYGTNEPDKPSKTYELIKTLVNFDKNEEVLFFVLEFKNISEKPINNMSVKFGFWEKNNQNKRIEQEFNFSVE